MAKEKLHTQAAEKKGKACTPPALQKKAATPEKQAGPMTTQAPAPETDTAGRARTMTEMQQTVGNARIGRMMEETDTARAEEAVTAPSPPIQTKLKVGAVDDMHEKEADRVADQTATMPDATARRKQDQGDAQPAGDAVQRNEFSSEIREDKLQGQAMSEQRAKSAQPAAAEIQRQEFAGEIRDDKLLPKPAPADTLSPSHHKRPQRAKGERTVPAGIETEVKAARGGGQPLPDAVRRTMEQKFGADFSAVRIHDDAQADKLCQTLGARAFTTGCDIFFRKGEYQPASGEGQKLLAHELAHVVQQKAITHIQRQEEPATASANQNVASHAKTDKTPAKVIELPPLEITGDPQFYSRAERLNKYYARHALLPGWPYTDKLRSLWSLGTYDDFADAVIEYQINVMGETVESADGILGSKTATSLQETNAPQAPGTANESQSPSAVKQPPADARLAQIEGLIGQIKHTSLSAILDELKQLAALKPKLAASNEESGVERRQIIQLINNIRNKITELNAVVLKIDPTILQAIKAQLYQKLNTYAPYYAQMPNINILRRPGAEAWQRTCNVTSLAMTLEALGVGSVGFSGDMMLINNILSHFQSALKEKKIDPTTVDAANLRLPDFLQLVAIYLTLTTKKIGAGKSGLGRDVADLNKLATSDPKKFGDTIDQAQTTARNLILFSAIFDRFTEYFGVKVTYKTHQRTQTLSAFGTYTKSLAGYEREKRKLATAIEKLDIALDKHRKQLTSATGHQKAKLERMITITEKKLSAKQEQLAILETKGVPASTESTGFAKKIAKLEKELASKRTAQATAPDKRQKRLTRQITALEKQLNATKTQQESWEKDHTAAQSAATMETALPLEEYKKSLIGPVNAILAAGKQVIVNRVSHFVRLESLDESGLVIDDPGTSSGKNMKVSWETARAMGFFRRYVIVEK